LFQSVEEHFGLMEIDKDRTIDLVDRSNYSWNRINYPLGSRRMTIWDIAQAYQTLFNDGRFIKLYSISSALNPYTYRSESIIAEKKELYDSKKTKIIQEALKTTLDVGGTAHSLTNILPERTYMSKTGTTDEYRHGYTILCDGDIMVVSWVSYGKEIDGQVKFGLAPIPNQSGGGSAGKLAAFIMNEITKR